MYNYIYKQRIPVHDTREGVAVGVEHIEVLLYKQDMNRL